MQSMLERNIALPLDAIRAFCERNHIRRLALFGSVLREDFGPDSDGRNSIGARNSSAAHYAFR